MLYKLKKNKDELGRESHEEVVCQVLRSRRVRPLCEEVLHSDEDMLKNGQDRAWDLDTTVINRTKVLMESIGSWFLIDSTVKELILNF